MPSPVVLDLAARVALTPAALYRKACAVDGFVAIDGLPFRLRRLARLGRSVYQLSLHHEVRVGYPSLLLLLGARGQRFDEKDHAGPTDAYIAYLHRLDAEQGATGAGASTSISGTRLLQLAIDVCRALGMRTLSVHDNSYLPGRERLPLARLLLLTRGTTFYGRLGFLPVLDDGGPDSLDYEDSQAYQRAMCASLEHVARAGLGEYVRYLADLLASVRDGDEPRLKFRAMGMDFCLPADKDAVPRATAAKRQILRLVRAALKAGGERPLVDALADGSLADKDVDTVIHSLAHPGSSAMTIMAGPTTYNFTKRPECWWPALEHFRTVLQAQFMRFEMQLQEDARRTNTVAGTTKKSMCAQ
jgi:hypothetical protein